MGIAGFFLWLQKRYGRAIVNLGPEEERREPSQQRGHFGARDGGRSPSHGASDHFAGAKPRHIDSVDCDNLYLDMNGLIHPCCHECAPLPEPKDEDEMMDRICGELDKLVKLVKPKKLLYMAVDGVAPRSKMNQQRERRFRAAQERQASDKTCSDLADYVQRQYGLPRPEFRPKWDHNVITPATSFMDRVGKVLDWYVISRLNSGDPDWSNLTVIISDAHIAGEGEHKIMQYIRSVRTQPGYNPNIRHMIHGQDADLIMLGLATHELHFTVLRNQLNDHFQPDLSRYCVLDVVTFRDCLNESFEVLCQKGAEFERLVDDFIFLCFFIGNDFLPHMPLVDIKARGIETMLDHYVASIDDVGHLTDGHGNIHFDRLRAFVDSFWNSRGDELIELRQGHEHQAQSALKHLQQALRDMHRGLDEAVTNSQGARTDADAQEASNAIFKIHVDMAKEQAHYVAGKQSLSFTYGEGDYRDQYYASRFGFALTDRKALEANIATVVREYLRGAQWVLRYYTSGCPSWDWCYGYHYAPLLQDVALYSDGVDTAMALGAPLHPLEQLLSVLPRESAAAFPSPLREAAVDPTSVLAPFFSTTFTVDFSEAIHSWQGVVLLPFVDGSALTAAIARVTQLPAVPTTLPRLYARVSSPCGAALLRISKAKNGAPITAADCNADCAPAALGTVERIAELASRSDNVFFDCHMPASIKHSASLLPGAVVIDSDLLRRGGSRDEHMRRVEAADGGGRTPRSGPAPRSQPPPHYEDNHRNHHDGRRGHDEEFGDARTATDEPPMHRRGGDSGSTPRGSRQHRRD